VGEERWRRFAAKLEGLEREEARLAATRLRPGQAGAADELRVFGQPLGREATLADLLRRPEVDYRALVSLPGAGPGVDDDQVIEQLEIQARYAGYLGRQQEEIERQRRNETTVIPDDFDFAAIRGLSAEVRQRLKQHRPGTVGQAGRISGVTPAAISLLLVHLKKRTLPPAA
jgi:tRNA uridine 5-carboxymethylaminomethyl modification enzyme